MVLVPDSFRDGYPRQQQCQPAPQHYQPSHSSYDIPYRCPPSQIDRANVETARSNGFAHEAFAVHPMDNSRPQNVFEVQRRQPPIEIAEALSQRCNIRGKKYFVAVMKEDGSVQTFLSPGPALPKGTSEQFFDENGFQQVMHRVEAGLDPNIGDQHSPGRTTRLARSQVMTRQRESTNEDSKSPRKPRKRPRGATTDDAVKAVKKSLRIGDSEAVRQYYHDTFVSVQQDTCRLLGKIWIKFIETKKQTKHPYTGGDAKAPEWWPKPWGPGHNERVRHREPDHSSKPERIYLLVYILRMLVEPQSNQHEDIRHRGYTVKTLESITFEGLSSFLSEGNKERKNSVKESLEELFYVAKYEARYKANEIDENSSVSVSKKDKTRKSDYAEEEDDDMGTKLEAPSKDHEYVKVELHHPRAELNPSQGVMHNSTAEERNTAAMHSQSMLGELPMRQFPSSMAPDMPSHHQGGYVGANGMQLHGQGAVAAPGPGQGMDYSRRPSHTFSDYSSPVGGNIFPQQWPSGSAAQNAPAAYAPFTQTTNGHPDTTFVGHGMSMNHNAPYLGQQFDQAPRPGYDDESLVPMSGLQLHPHTQ